MHEQLSKSFTPRRVVYISQVLSCDELRVLTDLADALVIARIKRMTPQKLKRFDRFIPRDHVAHRAYGAKQLTWLRDQEYLLGTRLGRSPTQSEVFRDFLTNQNGLRFRAYYTLKYRDQMKRNGASHPVC